MLSHAARQPADAMTMCVILIVRIMLMAHVMSTMSC